MVRDLRQEAVRARAERRARARAALRELARTADEQSQMRPGFEAVSALLLLAHLAAFAAWVTR